MDRYSKNLNCFIFDFEIPTVKHIWVVEVYERLRSNDANLHGKNSENLLS